MELLLPAVRVACLVAVTIAVVPMASLMSATISCSGTGSWLSTGAPCKNAAVVLARILAALLLLVYNGLLVFVAATYVDRNPASKSWSAKSHGQMDAAMLLVKVALVLCYSVFRDFVLDSWVLVVLLLLAGAAWLGMAVRYLPFVHPGMNAMQAGFACVFLWSTLVLALARYTDTGDQSLLLYLGSVLAYCGGFLACYMHEQFIAALPLEACESLVHLDVWARHRMQEYSRVVESRGSSVEQSRKGQHTVPIRRRPRYGGRIGRDAGNDDEDAEYGRIADNATMGSMRGGDQQADAAEYLQELPTASGGGGAASMAGGSSGGKSSDPGPARGSVQDGGKYGGMLDGAGTVAYAPTVRTDAGSMARLDAQTNHFSKQAGADGEDGHEDDVMQSLLSPEEDIASIDQSSFFGWRLANMKYATRRHREDEHRLYTAERAYRQMVAHFGQTAMAHVLAAEFYHQFCFENNFAEAQALAQARLRSPSLDLEAYVYGRTRELREGADSSKLSALDRVIFESLSRQAQESKVAAMRSILKLWDHLAGHKLELATVVGVGQEIETGLKKTDELYRTMMRLNQGALVARGYAEFLVELVNDPLTAMELFNKADRLEERHTRQRAKAVRHVVLGSEAPQVDLLDDNAANLTLSVADGSVGEILSASPSTCRVFGFANTSQITGLSFQTLLPEPVRGIYNQRLHRLQRCGFSDALNETEVSFVLPSSGSALPVIISLLESTPDEATSAPRLSVGIDVLRCDEHVIFFSGRDQGYKVLSASARSMLLLGTDSEQLQREPLPVTRFFPTVEHGRLRPRTWDSTIMASLLGGQYESSHRSTAGAQIAGKLVVAGRRARASLRLEKQGSFIRERGDSSDSGSCVDSSVVSQGTDAQGREKGTGVQIATRESGCVGAKTVHKSFTAGPVRRAHGRHGLPASLQPKPLLQVYETALILVQNAADKTDLVLGSVQDVSDQVGRSCFMLRWRMPSQVEREAMREQVTASSGRDSSPDSPTNPTASASPSHQLTSGRRSSFVDRVQEARAASFQIRPARNDTPSDARYASSGTASAGTGGPQTAQTGYALHLETSRHGHGEDAAYAPSHGAQLELQSGGRPPTNDGASRSSGASQSNRMRKSIIEAIRYGADGSNSQVGRIKCAFGVGVFIALFGGCMSMAVGYLLGTLLDEMNQRLFQTTDQAMAFVHAEQILWSVASVQDGAPVGNTSDFPEYVAELIDATDRHEARHARLLQVRSLLATNLASEDAQVRQWRVKEPSASASGDMREYDASLQELGTYMSSVMLQIAEANDSAVIVTRSPQWQAVQVNREEYVMALNRSISLRQLDAADYLSFAQTTFSIAGALIFAVVAGSTTYLIYDALAKIRNTATNVTQAVFMVSSSTAHKLKKRTTSKLTKLANQLEEYDEDDDDERMDLLDDEEEEEAQAAFLSPGRGGHQEAAPSRGARQAVRLVAEQRPSSPHSESNPYSSSNGTITSSNSNGRQTRASRAQQRHSSRRLAHSSRVRHYHDSWSFTWTNSLFMFAPILLGFYWVPFTLNIANWMASGAISSNERLVTSQRLAIDVVQLQRMASDLVLASSNKTRAVRVEQLRQIESRILQTSERIVLGETFVDESTGLENQLGPVEDEVARRLLLTNGCSSRTRDYDECFQADGGSLRSGIRNALVRLVRQSRQLRLSAPVPDLEPGVSQFMQDRPESFVGVLVGMREAVHPFTREGLEEASTRYANQSRRALLYPLDVAYVVIGIVTVLFICLFSYVYWGVPDSFVAPIRGAWQVVAMIPQAALQRTPGLQTRVAEQLGLVAVAGTQGSASGGLGAD